MIRTNAAPVVCFSDPDISARFMAAAVRSTPRHHTRSSVARISLGKTTSAARAGRQRAYCTPAGQRSKGGSVAAGTRHGRRGHTISITSLTISCTVLEQSSTVPVPNKLGSGCTRLQKQVRHGALGCGRRKAAPGPPAGRPASVSRPRGRRFRRPPSSHLPLPRRPRPPPPRRTGRKARALPIR